MATGSYDANGIWNYGEDDNIALFSDTLNLLAESTSDGFTDDRARLSTLEAGSLSGLVPLVPSSVTVATGTGAFNTVGKVTFSGATAVTLNGVFSSQYENYKVLINLTNATATTGNIISRVGATASGYAYQLFRGYSSTVSATASSAQTSWFIGQQGGAGAQSVIEMTLANPATASSTKMISQCGSFNSVDLTYINCYGQLIDNNVYTSFYFAPTTSNFTGSIQVFGIND